MRDVLVVLFWLWLLVALGVYGYRIVRRVSQGPKAERKARAAAGEADAAAPPRRAFGRTEPPPLPDGPLEPRLPRSLQGVVPEGEPEAAPAAGARGDGADEDADPVATPHPPTPAPTLAEALEGIRMPEALLPVVDPGLPGLADGRVARFSATGTTVGDVAHELADELRRLGYVVDGLDTTTSTRAGLSARRDAVTVAATVDLDQDTGAVRVELHT